MAGSIVGSNDSRDGAQAIATSQQTHTEPTRRLGIDVGGTFIDLVYSDDGVLREFKVPSDPADLVGSVVNGLRDMASDHDESLRDFMHRVPLVVHGTTITTNAVLARSGSKTALLTTEGLRDALQMRKSKKEEPYNLRYRAPSPVVPRYLRLPVRERLDWKGDVLVELDADDLGARIETLRNERVESVAVCYLHAYVDSTHEALTVERIRAEMPEAYVIGSSDALPLAGFYDRVSTIALAAYVGPTLFRYLADLRQRLASLGFSGSLLIMKSNGGVISPELAQRNPAVTLLSGPAGGPRAALEYLKPHGIERGITIDMGGTSFDASLIYERQPLVVPKGEIDRLRIALPMLDVHTIGAGGGSIAWFDEAGLLRMGPRSAGAVPGPACYGLGGQEATATDADLLLGYINADYFLGGRIQLDAAQANEVIESRVVSQLGGTAEAAAAGMFKIINVNMAAAIRQVSVNRGHDPREFPLVVAGGAGPIHAAMIAEELEINHILIPRSSAVFCATGMLFSDLQHDYVRSVWRPGHERVDGSLPQVFAEMVEEATRDLTREGVDVEQIEWRHTAEMRYAGQFHEVVVPVDPADLADGISPGIRNRFEALHDQLYGHTVPGGSLEVVHVRTTAIGRTAHPALKYQPAERVAAAVGIRRAFLPNRNAFADVPVYRDVTLNPRTRLDGPVLIDQPATTVFVPERWQVASDAVGTYILTRQPELEP